MHEHSRRPTEQFSPHQVRFVAEQDGAPERELKERLARSLRPLGVRNAYLAVVAYEDRKPPQSTAGSRENSTSVALCLTLQDGASEKHDIVEAAGAEFASMFGSRHHLDIVFLTDQQEAAAKKVCRPFYMAIADAGE